MNALLLTVVFSAAHVEVALFVPPARPELTNAITAQLTDLEIGLSTAEPPSTWETTEAAQLRQVRGALLGRASVRVAIWVELDAGRVHVADLWTNRHFVHALSFDSSGREAAALVVRSAVASFVEQDAAPPPTPIAPARFHLSAGWHVSKWSDAVPWMHGPLLQFSYTVLPPIAVWASARFELSVPAVTGVVKTRFQRSEVAIGAELIFQLGRVALRPRVGLALRWVRVTPTPLMEGVDTVAPNTDVGLAVPLGASISVLLFGPLEATLDGWSMISMRATRYQVAEGALPSTVVQPWPAEIAASIGLSVRL